MWLLYSTNVISVKLNSFHSLLPFFISPIATCLILVHFRLQTRTRSNKFVKIFSRTAAGQEKHLFLEEERLEVKMRAVSFLLLLHSVFYATALNKDGCRIVFVFMILPRILFWIVIWIIIFRYSVFQLYELHEQFKYFSAGGLQRCWGQPTPSGGLLYRSALSILLLSVPK